MLDDLLVEVVYRRESDLEHNGLVHLIEMSEDLTLEDLLSLSLIGAVDVHLGLEDRHQTVREDLLTPLKLLCHDSLDALLISLLDDTALLGTEDVVLHSILAEVVETGEVLHQLHAILLLAEALVDLEERNDVEVVPEVVRGLLAVDLTAHGALEEDHTDDLMLSKAGALDHTGTHLVDELKHLRLVAPGILGQTVGLQCLGRRATTLVKGTNKALAVLHLF